MKLFKRIVYHFFCYIYLKSKYRNKLIFGWSSEILHTATFEGANRVHPHSRFCGKMGYGSYIGPNCEINATIGRYTSIAPHVRTNTGFHPITKPFATTCPMFFLTNTQSGITFANRNILDARRSPTMIGNDVWIGENVFFVGGVQISDGAVVLAGAVVTKDVPPYAVVGGVPAKVVKYRYDNETIDFLLKLKWWDKDLSWLKENWELLCDVELLKKKLECQL